MEVGFGRFVNVQGIEADSFETLINALHALTKAPLQEISFYSEGGKHFFIFASDQKIKINLKGVKHVSISR